MCLPSYFHQIGKPIPVTKKAKKDITQQDIDELHATFLKSMETLFERTKLKHGCSADTKLLIL
jgi:hypothetical protein